MQKAEMILVNWSYTILPPVCKPFLPKVAHIFVINLYYYEMHILRLVSLKNAQSIRENLWVDLRPNCLYFIGGRSASRHRLRSCIYHFIRYLNRIFPWWRFLHYGCAKSTQKVKRELVCFILIFLFTLNE